MFYFCIVKALYKLFDFYINSSIHVALAAYSLVRITEHYFQIPTNEALNYFIFYGTITGYNFVKYAGVAKLHHRSLTNDLKIIQVFSLICFLAMCYYMVKLPMITLWVSSPFVLLTVLYAVPFLSGFEKNLRAVSYLKIVVVALVWDAFTVLVPVINAEILVGFDFYLVFLQRFLLIVVLILPFDLRDVKYDSLALQTIPKKVGEQNTKRLGVILLVITLVLEYMISLGGQAKNAFMLFLFTVNIRNKNQTIKLESSGI